jgi:hypothetical protein
MRSYNFLRQYPDSNYRDKCIRVAKSWAWGLTLIGLLLLVWAGLGAPVSYDGQARKNVIIEGTK